MQHLQEQVPKIKFTIEQHDDCWSFTTKGETHFGYPDALQAVAAAMRFSDPNVPREESADLDEVEDWLQEEEALTRRKGFSIIVSGEVP